MKKTLKTIALAIIALTMLTLLASCGGDKYDGISLDIAAFGTHIYENAKFDDELMQMPDGSLATVVPLGSSAAASVYFRGTGATPEEIIIIEASDKEAALGALEDRLASQKTTYTKYNADQKPKLNDAVVMTAGNYAIYVVSADNAGAEAVVTAYLDSQAK